MKHYIALFCTVALCGLAAAQTHPTPPKATQSITQGSVTVEGQRIDYTATAGTIILTNRSEKPTGSIFYVAYTKDGVKDEGQRPVMFLYNGGPGSSTIWLHMGSFAPVRIVTADHTHTPPAPYKLVSNEYSLLDASDLVFVDAMSTGYSRIIRKDEGGAGTPEMFYGVNQDAGAFAQFIMKYLSKNNRWNSPKYLYGESYGTVRSEVLANMLEQQYDIDPNGVVLQSAYTGEGTFGSDIEYANDLPTEAAVAWYHHKLPNQPAQLPPFLKQVEQWTWTTYAQALVAGNSLSAAQCNTVAEQLHNYTGLSTDFIKKANLRISEGEFRHDLLGSEDQTVGDLDGRFAGPSMNPLSLNAQYDPQSAGISAAYVAGFTMYAHNTLHYGRGETYRPEAYNIITNWSHSAGGRGGRFQRRVDPGADLASAMKYNPLLRVEVDAGYFDLNLPYGGMVYSVRHLSLPKALESHIQFKYYYSGHMIYVNVPSLKELHDNTAAFIRSTSSQQ
ncbi:MAG: peptidase S10 [Acidobacteria bacterium]|nr:MAG: peptidase S10 [Acidobacteriota bacterium]